MDKKRSLRHDINNHLAVISGYIQLIQGKAEDENIKKWAGVIKAECDKMTDLVAKKSD